MAMGGYEPPQHVIEEWKKHCQCCPHCSVHPCDGVAAGGYCDNVDCDCDCQECCHEWIEELEQSDD